MTKIPGAHTIRIFTAVMEQYAMKNVKSFLKTEISSYLETSGDQNFNLYLNVVNIFSTRVD